MAFSVRLSFLHLETSDGTQIIPLAGAAGLGFLDTGEGCALYVADIGGCNSTERNTYLAVNDCFNNFNADIKRNLTRPPLKGEYIIRAGFWRNKLKPILTPHQRYIAMQKIIGWYKRCILLKLR